MELKFERGDRHAPKGHAFLYFSLALDPRAVLATYIVVLPLELDIAKYMPPMFAGSLGAMQMQSPSVIPMPPIPERMETLEMIQRLAEARDDDVVFGGQVYEARPEYLLGSTGEAAQTYVSLYQSYVNSPGALAEEPQALPEEDPFAHMDETQRLEELVKLTGTLRYATEAEDKRLIAETVEQMRMLAERLPSRYRVEELVEAAQMAGGKGQRLCELHIERCYKLRAEQYADLVDIEMRISNLQKSSED